MLNTDLLLSWVAATAVYSDMIAWFAPAACRNLLCAHGELVMVARGGRAGGLLCVLALCVSALTYVVETGVQPTVVSCAEVFCWY